MVFSFHIGPSQKGAWVGTYQYDGLNLLAEGESFIQCVNELVALLNEKQEAA